jgi:hypothetical protein
VKEHAPSAFTAHVASQNGNAFGGQQVEGDLGIAVTQTARPTNRDRQDAATTKDLGAQILPACT